jgi:hypothetical protein
MLTKIIKMSDRLEIATVGMCCRQPHVSLKPKPFKLDEEVVVVYDYLPEGVLATHLSA